MFTIDREAPAQPFEQLKRQIIAAITSGHLAPGERLPTVRGLASSLGVAPGTVARAYRELEHAGIVETHGRHGTFVSLRGDTVRREAQRAAAEFVQRTIDLGITTREATRMIDDAFRARRSNPA